MHELDGLNEIREKRRSFDSITSRWGALVGLCCSPLFFVFAYFGDPGRGMAAMISSGLIVVLVKYFWDLRNRVWFWITIAFIVGLHVALVLLIPWPDNDYRGIQLLPFALLDFGIVYGIIRLVESAAG